MSLQDEVDEWVQLVHKLELHIIVPYVPLHSHILRHQRELHIPCVGLAREETFYTYRFLAARQPQLDSIEAVLGDRALLLPNDLSVDLSGLLVLFWELVLEDGLVYASLFVSLDVEADSSVVLLVVDLHDKIKKDNFK